MTIKESVPNSNHKRRELKKTIQKDDRRRAIELQYGMARNSLEPVKPTSRAGSAPKLVPIRFTYPGMHNHQNAATRNAVASRY